MIKKITNRLKRYGAQNEENSSCSVFILSVIGVIAAIDISTNKQFKYSYYTDSKRLHVYSDVEYVDVVYLIDEAADEYLNSIKDFFEFK